MTFGEKIKDLRKRLGITQEEFAEKLNISRQAVTKWESDIGLPDTGNLQILSSLFNVSIDYLLDNKNDSPLLLIREKINLNEYSKEGFRGIYDAIAKKKFPEPYTIYPLIRRKKMNKLEAFIDFIIQPGIVNVIDSLEDLSAYYLVERNNIQLLINIRKEYIETKELNVNFNKNKCIIDNNLFIKANYKI